MEFNFNLFVKFKFYEDLLSLDYFSMNQLIYKFV